jgi:hypothetical protein
VSIYEIRVRGRLDAYWAAWLEGLTLTHEGDNTLLCGPLADEAALHGVLTKVGGLNLQLLSVNIVETGGVPAGASPPMGTAPTRTETLHSASTDDKPAQKTRARKLRKRPPKGPP